MLSAGKKEGHRAWKLVAKKNTEQLWSHGCIGRLKCDECMQPVPDESSEDACKHATERLECDECWDELMALA